MIDSALIKVVGVSAAGKSTLVSALRRMGFDARPAAQEHSEVPDMWRRIRPPDWLIFLDADLPAQDARRPDVTWSELWRRTELERLDHARRRADLLIDTSSLPPERVLNLVVAFLQKRHVRPAPRPLSILPRTGSVRRRP